MHVHTIGGSLVATMVDYPANWADMLVRSKVRLRGVIAAIFNQHRQAVGVRMFIPGGQIQVLQPGPANPFALPLSPFSSVGQLHSLQELPKAIRVRATVSAIQPGIGMYISDGSLSMEAQDANQCAAQPGDLVDFVGFPGLLEGRPALENSICRKAGADASVPPQVVSADQILPLPRVEDASGYGYSVDSRYDMQVVRMEGKLLETSNSQDGEIWMLTSGKTSFDALIPPGQFENGQQLQSGTHLRLTGVCIVSFDQFGRGQSFRLLLRTPADVVVLGRPPWWSLKHAAWILAIGLVSFLAAILWISVLRRQVEQKTEQIRKTNEILQELSEQDGLTGIANRRRFDMKLNAEWSRARRSGSPLSLLLIDIDAFKALNDEYGHLRGDECLVTVARTMNSMALRSVDLVARYGGEEFAVILPGTDLPGAMEVGERLRATIQALGVPHNGSRFGQVLTISVGVATTGPGSRTACSGLVELADRALYRSKTRGRNRVTSSEEVPHPSEADTPDLQGYAEPRA
jgi:diguanylate cyclase (GGDEF)-like protein